MIKKHLTIDLFRVSADSRYLDLLFSVPEEFYMNSLKLTVKDTRGLSVQYDLSVALGMGSDNTQKDWTVRIPLYKLKIDYPAIYIADFKAQGIDETNSIEDQAICSDVNDVYRCLLDSVIDSCDKCSDGSVISDDVIRNYLLLYGHHAAMFAKDYPVMEKYFSILSKCFKNCKGEKLSYNSKPDCGCSK